MPNLPALVIATAAAAVWHFPAHGADIAGTEASAPLPADALAGEPLWSALRAGGYVVYFRHTATDFSRNDSRMTGFDDCDNQRPLIPQGRDDARRIGAQIRLLGLAGGEVLASPMCRTMEHARLTFAGATPTPALRESGGGDFPGLKQLLAGPVTKGSNRWLFGHGMPFRAVAGPPHLSEGEAVVIRPGGSSWTIVARIPVAGWTAPAAPP